jgi:glycolate oxidase iron-sulfur subunit
MKSILEGDLELEEALPYLDRCLGCLACVTACPSGVPYGELITPFKAYAQERRQRPLTDRSARRLALETLPYPDRFRLSTLSGRLAKPFQSLLPDQLRAMLTLLPETLPASQPLPALFPTQGQPRARVALLAGCVQQVLAPEINWATLRVLARNGVETLIPEDQGCCGALSIHAGESDSARALASQNMRVFPSDVDAILTNAAGCGSGMHEYPLLFKGTELETQSVEFASSVQDICVFLHDLGILEPLPLPDRLVVAYHDACHLAHAQGVTAAPRNILNAIPNLEVLEIQEPELCCGSAGMYNIEQPETANALGERKARHVLESGASALVTGNIGCLVQLRNHLNGLGSEMPVWHTLEVLDRAYRGWV